MERRRIEIEDYNKTNWRPHVVDPLTGDVVSEGTRFTSKRANNFEEGIWINRELHKKLNHELIKLRTEVELSNRVPGGNSFFDVFTSDDDDIKGLSVDTFVCKSTHSVVSNTITVDNAIGLQKGLDYALYDNINFEIVRIKDIKDNTITIEDLQHSYKRGAILTRTACVIDNGMKFTSWGSLKVEGEVL